MDAFLTLGEHLEKEGFTQSAAKRLLSQGGSSCLVVPLLAASVDVQSPTKGAGSLRDVIELDCKGKLTLGYDSRYRLEFSEVKSSLEGKAILMGSVMKLPCRCRGRPPPRVSCFC